MAIDILKNTPIHTVVAVYGAGSETINLSTTLPTSLQTPSTPVVHIRGIYWSIPSGEATIARNSIVLWEMTFAQNLEFAGLFTDNRQPTSDIVVTIPAGGGTVILELMKISGYGDSQHINPLPFPTTTTTTTIP
jgi:hypothetical protein